MSDDEKKIETLNGSDIDHFYTVGRWNNNETIGIVANKRNFRLRIDELNKIKDSICFKVDLASNSNDARRTNNYLEIMENLNSYQDKKNIDKNQKK